MTYVDVMQVKKVNNVCMSCFITTTKLIKHLIPWGKIEIIKENTNIKEKLKNRGLEAMFVDYCHHHPQGTYRFIKLINKQVVITRNYKWIEKKK